MIGQVNTIDYIPSIPQALVPLMSSDSNPPWQIIYSTPTYSNQPGSYAFNNNLEQPFHSVQYPSYPIWIGFYNNQQQSYLTSIKIDAQRTGSTIFTTRAPKQIDVQGSNDGNTWNIIGSFTSSSGYSQISYTIPKYNDWYYWYRIYIYNCNGDSYCTVGALQFYGWYR